MTRAWWLDLLLAIAIAVAVTWVTLVLRWSSCAHAAGCCGSCGGEAVVGAA